MHASTLYFNCLSNKLMREINTSLKYANIHEHVEVGSVRYTVQHSTCIKANNPKNTWLILLLSNQRKMQTAWISLLPTLQNIYK